MLNYGRKLLKDPAGGEGVEYDLARVGEAAFTVDHGGNV